MATRVERRIVLNRSISLLAGIGAALLSGHEAQAQQLPEPADAPLTVPLVVPSTATASPNPPIPRRPSAIAPFERQLSAAPAAGQPTTISAGRTPTTFSVGNSGAASYSIPVWTPPGVGSVQLTLALSYSSRSRDGLLGVGWSLAGLSTITRCNRTWAQDGAPQGITLTTSDRLCLDGQQLKVVTGTPATPAQGGTTFATEIESFSQITAAGSSGSAPTSLTVTTKNGLIYDYGLTVDSQILAGPNGPIRTWALSQIRDRVGNKIKFSYYNDAESGSGYTDGSYRVKEIDYPYTASGQGPFYSVTFAYSARPSGANTPGGYIAGSLVTEPNELTTVSIQNYGSSTPTKVYYLTYSTNSVSSRLQLQQVQECSASNCLPATTIAYQAGAQGWSGSALSAGVQSSTQASPIAIDLNGDGLTDLLYPVTVNSSSVHWWIVFSTGSGFGSPVDTGITTGNFPTIIIGAFSGSGQNQVFVGQSGYWYVYTCNTSGCTAANTNVPVNGEMFAADYDGDGLPDLVSAVGNSVLVRRNTTTPGGAVSFASSATTIWTASSSVTLAPNNNGIFYAADFNADGRADILATTTLNTGFSTIVYWNILLSNGFGSAPTAVQLRGSNSNFPTAGDWNGDGCTDIISAPTIYISNCAGGFTALASPGAGDATLALDWDGDGNTDLLYNNNGTWYVARSTGTGIAAGVSTGISAPPSTSWFPLDQNGDGLIDLAYVDTSSGNGVFYRQHAGSGTPPDLATSFTDGFAMNQSPTYVPLPQNNYTKYSDATFPEQDYQGPLYVVNQFTASDGTGSTYQQQFWYYGARTQAQGRGFEGFYARRSFDTRNSVYTFDYVGRTYPFTGMFTDRLVIQSPNYLVTWQGSPSSTVSGGSGYEQRTFAFLSGTLENDYEYGGSLNGQTVKSISSSYTYGDGYGNPTAVSISTTDLDPNSPFYNSAWQTVIGTTFLNDSTAWCLGLPTGQTVEYLVPGQSNQTHTYSFTPDSNHALCREQQQVVEPATTALTTTTSLGFDSCGNVNSISVAGHNPDGTQMSVRTTSIGYGTRCQLPESIQNALLQTTGIAYLYDFGVPTQVTDPNLVPLKWAYDDFGRKNKETRADQTYSTFTYYYCNSPPCWGVNDLRFSVFRDDYGTDGSLVGAEGIYNDGFSRLRYDQTTHAFGTTVNEQIKGYDSLGRLNLQYQPMSSSTNGYFTLSYDPLNRLTSENLYQSSGALDRTMSWGYSGRTTTITNPRNASTGILTDVVGRTRRVIDPSPGGTMYYDFDASGNLNRIQDPVGAVSTASYNLLGFKTNETDADAGIWTFSGDSLNELVSWTDARTHSFGAAYDALGRRVNRTEPEGTSTWTWGNTQSAHNIGSLQSVSGYGYSENLTYDSLGRLQSRAISTDQAYQFDYAYNAVSGLIDTLTYPTSTSSTRFKIQYGYSYGYPTQITDVTVPASPATLWTLSATNDYYSATSESLGSNVLAVSRGYKAWTDEPVSIQSGVSGSTTNRQNLAYQWDVDGNLAQRQDLNQSLTETLSYDPLDRLQSSTLNNLTIGYDAAGDITTRSDVGSYTYGDSAHPHGVTAAGSYSFAYDANGNVSSRNGLALTWTSFNLPASLQATIGGGTYSSQFSYGPKHERFQQSATYSNGTEVTSYAGGLFEKVTGSDMQGITSYRHYIPTPSGLTIVIARNSDGSSATRYVLSDHLGSGDALVDGTGNLVVQESFAAYGTRRGSNWTGSPSPGDYQAIASSTRHGFTFQEELDNLALIHMNGRVYDPNVGRFLSADPLIGRLADSQSINPYSYVGNRPLSAVDPTGLIAEITITAPLLEDPEIGIPVIAAEFLLGGLFGGAAPPPPPPASVSPNASAQSGMGSNPCTQPGTACEGGGLQEITVTAVKPAATGGLENVVPPFCPYGELCVAIGNPPGPEYCGCLPPPPQPAAPAGGSSIWSRVKTGFDSFIHWVNEGAPGGSWAASLPALGALGAVGELGEVPALARSPWALGNFARGRAIEQALGANLPSNFPVIDQFSNGIATSIKSVNLAAPTYQNIATLSRTVTGYINQVASFTGRTWGGVSINASQISGRALQLVVPAGSMSAAQQAALQEAIIYGQSVGVSVTVVPF